MTCHRAIAPTRSRGPVLKGALKGGLKGAPMGVLIAALISMGQAIAGAHLATGPAGQIEICAGTGPVMIYVDSDGQPTAPPEYCPKGALGLFHAFALTAPAATRPGGETLPRMVLADCRAPDLAAPRASARGPPPTRDGIRSAPKWRAL